MFIVNLYKNSVEIYDWLSNTESNDGLAKYAIIDKNYIEGWNLKSWKPREVMTHINFKSILFIKTDLDILVIGIEAEPVLFFT